MKRRIGFIGTLVVIALALALPATTAAAGVGVKAKVVENYLFGSTSNPSVFLSTKVVKSEGMYAADKYTIDAKIVAIDDYGDGSAHTMHVFSRVTGMVPGGNASWQSQVYEYTYRPRDYRGNQYNSNEYFKRIFIKVKIWDGNTLLKTFNIRSYSGI